jgi:hypothetical protein
MSLRFFRDRVIAYKNNNNYLAVSLEFDLLAEEDNMQKALERLYCARDGYLKLCYEDNETDEEIYRKASKKYFDKLSLI